MGGRGAKAGSIEQKILNGTVNIWHEKQRLLRELKRNGSIPGVRAKEIKKAPTVKTPPNIYEQRILKYAERVVNGQIDAPLLVQKACARHLRDLDKADKDPDYPYKFELKPENICHFAEQQIHIKGFWARPKKQGDLPYIKLEDWQCFVLGVTFGWVRKSDGLRRFRELYAEIPRKNGKSVVGAIIGLFMAFVDGEMGAEVYAGATNLAQAMQVFRPAWLMCKRNPWMLDQYGLGLSGTEGNPTTIHQLATGSRFEPVIGKPGDGPSPHCAIVDEYHEHQTPDLYDTMKTGMGARQQPLRAVITTAGTNTSGPCYDKHLEAVKVLDGVIENEELFAIIYAADESDDWEDLKVWRKVNPNYGVSVLEDYLISQRRDAIQNVSQQNINRTKHLNQWLNAGVGWMDMTKWTACAHPEMRLEDFKGQQCCIAVDAANKIDIMSLAFIFKRPDYVAFFTKNYLCRETIEKPENAHYRKWRESGWLIEAGEARTDHRAIEEDIKRAAEMFSIQQLAYDPREANYLMSSIEEWAKFECVEITQGHALMSEPMKEMEGLIYSGQLAHCDDPCLSWQMSNVVKKQGQSGPVKYYYPSKERDVNKIDGVVAGIMALGRAMVFAPPEEKKYQALFF